MKFGKLKISKLVENNGQIEGVPRNPRQWSKEDVEKLKASIQETPELLEARGCIVYPSGDKYVVLGGNMRLAACKQLGYKEVDCAILDEGTTPDKLREIVIKDNGSFGQWDFDMLANEWDDLPLVDWGIDMPDVVSPDGFGDSFTLADGEKAPFQQMTFTLADAQAESIKLAVEAAKYEGGGESFGNTNSNGNALYKIVKEWDDARKLR